MAKSIRHECGGRAYVSGQKAVQGWNTYCCSRCGEVVKKWITAEMLKEGK